MYSGRLMPEKGVDVLLKAMALLYENHPRVRLWILGDGPDRPRLEGLAGDLGIRTKVSFHGHLPWHEAQSRLAAAWIQCVPSLWQEPFGLVTAEAQFRGTPVVASRVGAQPELIEDGVTGFLVPPGDSEALAAQLGSLIDNPATLRSVGAAGRAWARQAYDGTVMIHRLLDLYRSILNGE
jgi:glycosyltransferase involved in cell wall biosynthesis